MMKQQWLLHLALLLTRPLRAGWYRLVRARWYLGLFGSPLTYHSAYRITRMMDELRLDPVRERWLTMMLSASHPSWIKYDQREDAP